MSSLLTAIMYHIQRTKVSLIKNVKLQLYIATNVLLIVQSKVFQQMHLAFHPKKRKKQTCLQHPGNTMHIHHSICPREWLLFFPSLLVHVMRVARLVQLFQLHSGHPQMYLLEVVVNFGNNSTHSRSFTWNKFDLVWVFAVLDKRKILSYCQEIWHQEYVCLRGIEFIVKWVLTFEKVLLKRWALKYKSWRWRWDLDFPRINILGWCLGIHFPSKERLFDGHFWIFPSFL